MLTRAAPAFNRATDGAMPSSLLQPLSQALFNCNQALEHRGPVAFGNASFPQRGGVLTNQGGWDPSSYPPELFPGSAGFVEAPSNGGYRAGDWYSTFYGSPEFDLRTSLTQNLNQYYSGPSVTIQGSTYTQNLTTENHNAFNMTVQNINGEPAPGQPGAAGPAGPQGAPGAAGRDGGVIFGGFLPAGQQLLNRKILAWIRVATRHFAAIEQALRSLDIEGFPQNKLILKRAIFDEDSCTVDERGQVARLKISAVRNGVRGPVLGPLEALPEVP